MKVYYEFIIILNFLLDFMILYGTKRVLKRKANIMRLLLGSIIGSSTIIFLFVETTTLELLLIKIIISTIMILISFGLKDFIRNIFYFYILSIIIGGSIYLLDLQKNNYFYYIALLITSISVLLIFIKEILNYHTFFHQKYLVTIIYQNKKYKLEGFIDTGNQLVSPIKKESVILVHIKIPTKNILYVPYKALNTSGVIPCFRPDKVVINNHEFSNCLVGLAKDKFSLKGVDCILPNKFKEELC